jgi:uncharacterized protein (TIGR02598 family)
MLKHIAIQLLHRYMGFVMTIYCTARKVIDAIFGGFDSFHHLQRRRRSTAGFSLVEVALAMGIVAFAFIPLLGLVPMGLNTSRQAIDTTIQAQIVQYMTDQAQQTNFSSLSGLASATPTCFDAYGNVTTASAAVYKASYSAPVNTVLPGGATTQTLDTITIYILSTRTPGGMTATNLATNSASKKYTVFVANNGL